MSNQMLFLSGVVNSFDEPTPDPFFARYLSTFNQQQRYTVTFSQTKTYSLDTAEAVTIIANSSWRILVIKVVGEIELASAGTDASSSAISGLTRTYGVSIFPGWLIWSTANLTSSLTLTAKADGTVVEVFNANLEADA